MAHQSCRLIQHTNGVAELTLTTPEKHNAFDDVCIQQLTDHLQQLRHDANCRLLLLSAEGKSFSAGADLAWMQRMINYSEAENLKDSLALAELMDSLYSFPLPTIARVQGPAFGGGVGLVACCDIAIAADTAAFCFSEVKLGLIPAVISPYVIAAIGQRAAQRYFLSAEKFSAAQAQQIGLVSEVVAEPDLTATTEKMINSLLANERQAQIAAKHLIFDVVGQSPAELKAETAKRIAAIRVSAPAQQALRKFLQR